MALCRVEWCGLDDWSCLGDFVGRVKRCVCVRVRVRFCSSFHEDVNKYSKQNNVTHISFNNNTYGVTTYVGVGDVVGFCF
jgi:hypothetical protein